MGICKLVIVLTLIWSTAAWGGCDIATFFSPSDNVEAIINQELIQAKKSVHCSLFGISNPTLVQGLLKRKQGGVEVAIAEDKKQAALASDLHHLLQMKGIKIVIKKTATLEHNKFCVIDGETALMGSWNWPRSAQKQDNSEVVIKNCPEEVKRFEQAFRRIIERDSE